MNDNGNIERPGISPCYLKAQDIRRVNAEEAAVLLGYRTRDNSGGIWIPYFNVAGTGGPLIVNNHTFGRLRLDNPGPRAKYLSPRDSGAQLYVPRNGGRFGKELVICEGEFKAISVCEAGVRAVAIGGICSAISQDELIPGLAKLLSKWPPGVVYFLGDADTSLKFDFSREAAKLAHALPDGCNLKLPRISLSAGGNGIDDCRAALNSRFPAFWETITAAAVPVPAKTDPGTLAVRLLTQQLPAIKNATDWQERYLPDIIALASHLGPLPLDNLASIVKKEFDISIPAFRKAAKQSASERRQKTHQAAQDKKEASDSLQGELAAKCGPPFTGEGKVNEAYFVQRFAREHHVLYEQVERSFFRYEAQNGAWRQVDRDVIKEAIRSDWENLVPLELRHLANDNLLSSLTNGVKSFVGRTDVFKRLPLGLIHVKNGMLKITSEGQCDLLPFDPLYYSRNPIPFDFNPEATAPRFLKMLFYPVDRDDADLLMRIIGSCLLEGNHAQRFAILEGAQQSSKTTIVNILEGIIGRQNTGELRTHLLDERFEIGRLVAKTLLTARDVAGNFMQHRSSYNLKKLVGHDHLEGEIKGSMKSFQITGDYAVLVTANETLLVWLRGENDMKAWRRRMIIIAFTKSVDPKNRIDKLDELLLREEGEGILLQAIQAAIKHLKELENGGDFVLTEIQQDRVDKLLSESQSIRFFVEDGITQTPDADLTTDEIVSAYVKFCKARGWKAQPSKVVEKQLPDLMLEIHSARQSRHIQRYETEVRGYLEVELEALDTP